MSRAAHRVHCPAIRPGRKTGNDEFDFEVFECKQHGSAEFSGACCKDHKAQCLEYVPVLFGKYFEWFILRHEKPALIPKLAALKKTMGRITLDKMEVSIGYYPLISSSRFAIFTGHNADDCMLDL
jgi:hypothetical protein